MADRAEAPVEFDLPVHGGFAPVGIGETDPSDIPDAEELEIAGEPGQDPVAAFRKTLGPGAHHFASLLYLAAGLMFRYAWVGAGRASARHDRVVAQMARERRHGT